MQRAPSPYLISSRGRVAQRLAAVAVGAVALVVHPVTVIAQAPPAATPDPAAIEMALTGAPVSYGPGDNLALRLRVTNGTTEPLENLRIRVGIRDRVLSRSALQDSYEAPPGFESSTLPVDVPTTIGAGETQAIVVDEPVDSFPTLAGAVDGGVFPATLSLQEETGATTFASVTVPLIYHPEPPEVPLDLHLLLPLSDSPARAASGAFTSPADGGPGLLGGVTEGGWLDAYLDALEEATADGRRPLRISVAPTPRLLEELADLADGARLEQGEELAADSDTARSAADALDRMNALLRRDTVEPLLVPYASPDLPETVANLPLHHMAEQFSAASAVWREVTDLSPEDGWLFPPGGRLDAPTLEQLQLLGHGGRFFLNEDSLLPLPSASAGCPEPFLSFTCAIEVRTDAGTSEGLLVDGLLAQMFGRLAGTRLEDRLTLQQIFAETAMVHAELPGTPGRVLQATIPSTWRPLPGLARDLLGGLASAPWIRTRTGDAILDASEPARREIVDRSTRASGAPDELFYARVGDARSLLDSYASAVPPGSDRLQRLRRNVLVATSRSWWRAPADAARYLDGSVREVEEEFAKITMTGASEITLTSKRGPLQIVISNDTVTPVRLALRLISPNLRFDQDRIVDTYPPGSHPLTLEPTATGSGVFQVAARLETTDGAYIVDERRIVVRSTSFNQIALGLTVGAFAFLVLFYIFKVFRGRSEPATE